MSLFRILNVTRSVCVFALVLHCGSLSADAEDPTYDDMVRVLNESPRPSTIAQFLAKLSAKYPEYFQGFTSVYRTNSLHDASFENPRAIVYGRTARLVITFNGDPGQANYENLEIMHFKERDASFEFREISFNEFGRPGQPENTIHSPDVISSRGDIHCSSCHGETSSRPNWAQYFNWPGVYGADDDSSYARLAVEKGWLAESNFTTIKNIRRFGPTASIEATNDLEFDHLARFSESRKGDPRYRFIIKGFADAAQSKVGFANNSYGNVGFKVRMNHNLTALLTLLNGRRVAALFYRDVELRPYALTAFGLYSCDYSFNEYIEPLVQFPDDSRLAYWIPGERALPMRNFIRTFATRFREEEVFFRKASVANQKAVFADFGYAVTGLFPIFPNVRKTSYLASWMAAAWREVKGIGVNLDVSTTLDRSMDFMIGSRPAFDLGFWQQLASHVFNAEEFQSVTKDSGNAFNVKSAGDVINLKSPAHPFTPERCAKIRAAAHSAWQNAK